MSSARVVCWSDTDEWLEVFESIFRSTGDRSVEEYCRDQNSGYTGESECFRVAHVELDYIELSSLPRLQAWQARGNLPMAILVSIAFARMETFHVLRAHANSFDAIVL
jgi:hypothetical protein